MKKRLLTFACLTVAVAMVAGCEDGPKTIFEPLDDGGLSNTSGETWTQPGSRGYDDENTGDRVGRARFCDEAEADAQIAAMASMPIIPDTSVGGVPVWGPGGTALRADDLLGRPEDGKLCDPTAEYADAFVYGPTNEVIIFFDQETRLVESIIAYTSYLGTMQGNVTIDGTPTEIVVRPRERISIGGRELDQYASRANEASRTNSWLNHANVTALYGMVRETFFGDGPLPADFDCVDQQLCDVIYTSADESTPQDTFVVIQDSGIQIRFTPEGQVTFVLIEPVRVAPFEVAGQMTFGTGSTVAPAFTSVSKPGCLAELTGGQSWADFRAACIDSETTLSRVNYNVHTQRDAVNVEFNGLTLTFLRETTADGVFEDGEAPADTDILSAVNFTRSLAAPVPEFVPANLANLYEPLLEARVRSAAPAGNPLNSFDLVVPAGLSTDPQRIGELMNGNASWLPEVIAQVQGQYDSLTDAQQDQVDPRVTDPVFLIEPFVQAVVQAFSHNHINDAGSVVRMRTTDDRRWSIGTGHFVFGGALYRIEAQYSLNFGAITAVNVSRGESEVDGVFGDLAASLRPLVGMSPSRYYDIRFAFAGFEPNPYRLGGDGINVTGVDRELGTVDVELTRADRSTIALTVPGSHVDDRSGFLRQIRGERFEFVRAHQVTLYGKETLQTYYVLEDGTIGRVSQPAFKAAHTLCNGLDIAYGDNIRDSIEAWHAAFGDGAYADCELVFNYSEDGTVLDSVASLQNRTSFVTVSDRAVTVSVWQ